MSRAACVLSATAGVAAGFLAMASLYSKTFFRTCRNVRKSGGFECSECGSHTEYEAKVPFVFCPMCGAFVMKRGEI